MRGKQRGEMILDTSTAITGQSAKRARLSPALRISLLLHAAAAVLLATHPDAWPWGLAVLGANHLALFFAVLCPRGQLLGPNLVRLSAPAVRRREISLTFDDGPDPEVTPRVLELLDRYQAKARDRAPRPQRGKPQLPPLQRICIFQHFEAKARSGCRSTSRCGDHRAFTGFLSGAGRISQPAARSGARIPRLALRVMDATRFRRLEREFDAHFAGADPGACRG